MAATPGEESVYDSGRLSLFDVILEKTREQNKKQLVHRLVYVSKIRQDIPDRRDVGAHYEKLFKNIQTQVQGEAVTGFLLIYPTQVVHVVESSANILLEAIRDLEEDERSISGMLQQTKILVFTDDLPKRLFSQWSFRTLNLSASRMQEYTTQEPIDVVVMEALTLLLKLSDYLAKLPKISLSKTMDLLPEKVPELLIRQDLTEYLLNSKDLGTPAEFIKRHTRPLDLVLNSELIWPVQTRLFPLN